MPDPKDVEQQALVMRVRLRAKYRNRDWHKLNYDEIRRFLHFLFSDNPRGNGYGIFVFYVNAEYQIRLMGRIVGADVVDIEPSNDNQ